MYAEMRPGCASNLFAKFFIPVFILWSGCSSNLRIVSASAESGDDTFAIYESEVPQFVTRGSIHRAVIGETIVLPCQVNNLGRYLLLWKRGNAVLSAGDLKISIDSRIDIVDGYKLEIKKLRIQDAGDYSCQLNTLTPQDQVHTLEILVPPSVKSEPSSGHVTLTKGDSVTLQCRANGNPPPMIRWTRKNNLLPNGEQFIEGNTFNIQKAGRHQAGIYVCSASNGVGSPVSTAIQVKVQYPPEIEVERTWIHSGEGYEAQLVCLVHSDPPSTVRWYRDTLSLHTTDRRLVEERGARHSLLIRKVHGATDFGNYSCEADNKLGRVKKHLELTGRPNRPIFRNDAPGKWHDSFNVTWLVESFVPVIEYRLLYRKVIANRNDTKGPSMSMSMPNEWNDVVLPGAEYMHATHQGNSITMLGASALVADVKAVDSIIHVKSYQVKHLEPQTNYEAQVFARNKFGVSQPSELLVFRTRKTELQSSFEGSPRNDLLSDPDFRDMRSSGAPGPSSTFLRGLSCLQSMSIVGWCPIVPGILYKIYLSAFL